MIEELLDRELSWNDKCLGESIELIFFDTVRKLLNLNSLR